MRERNRRRNARQRTCLHRVPFVRKPATAGRFGRPSLDRRGGFTLIEILIVVIILGILAAIVIPQFSSASTQARTTSLQSTAQTLRSQIALYKLQHGDNLPDLSDQRRHELGPPDPDQHV